MDYCATFPVLFIMLTKIALKIIPSGPATPTPDASANLPTLFTFP